MIYRKDINERSPLRVFERSIHGGLGQGNIGLVMSRAGLGKTAFLVDVALDACMRDDKVLHVDTEHTAQRVREYYEEVFRDLAQGTGLEDRENVHLQVERNRMIHSFLHGSFSLERVQQAMIYMKEHIDFVPSCIILDGFPAWEQLGPQELTESLQAVKKMAVEAETEIWISAQGHREDERDELGVPLRLHPYLEYLSVVVRLVSKGNQVRLQLVKDHENPDLADLHIELDPKTLLLKWR
jgi:hypothetical protein